MQKIPVSKAAKGMVLAKPIARDNGVVLMGEGTELTDQIIGKLRDFDIKKITVKGRPVGTGLEEEKTLEQLYAEIDERFKTVADDTFCTKIKALIKKETKRCKEENDL
ncbi:MAG: hypothetical protein GY868_05385 [Deltaproteobacteria bacterium]|nr:hypothetical protein [Deltaproteobacteria bacterium]